MEWVCIHTAQGDSEAIVIKSVLESNGIPYKEKRESLGRLYGVVVDGLGKIELFVPEDRAEEALEILDSAMLDV